MKFTQAKLILDEMNKHWLSLRKNSGYYRIFSESAELGKKMTIGFLSKFFIFIFNELTG